MYGLSKKKKCYALFGLLLGDGCYRNGRIYIKHTNKQRDYVKFLAKWCRKNNLKFSTRYDFEATGTFGTFIYSSISIKVPSRRHFDKFNRVFSKDKQKIVSDYVLNRISDVGLLFWYLDDGNLNTTKQYYGNGGQYKVNRFAHLNTQCFGLYGNKKIQKMLKKRFDMDVGIHKNRSKLSGKLWFRIYINATNFRKLYDIFKPYYKYIPKNFEYKFNMCYEPNRLHNSTYLSENYNFKTK